MWNTIAFYQLWIRKANDMNLDDVQTLLIVRQGYSNVL